MEMTEYMGLDSMRVWHQTTLKPFFLMGRFVARNIVFGVKDVELTKTSPSLAS